MVVTWNAINDSRNSDPHVLRKPPTNVLVQCKLLVRAADPLHIPLWLFRGQSQMSRINRSVGTPHPISEAALGDGQQYVKASNTQIFLMLYYKI